MLEEITSGVHGFAEREFEDWAPVQLIATADKPLELLWANEYSVFLPQTLAIVDRAALEAHNKRMAELEERLDSSESARLWDAICRIYQNPEAFVESMEREAELIENGEPNHAAD